jgi:hypothetical protein
MKARDNPFRAARVLSAIRYRMPGAHAGGGKSVGVDALIPRLESLHFRAAIVGPHGSGKTTLLEQRGFRIVHLRLDTDDPRLPREWRPSAWLRARLWAKRQTGMALRMRLDRNDIVCLDGAEQLGAIAWAWFERLTRRAGGLIVTTHAPGRLPTLFACKTNVTLLDGIMRQLAADGLVEAPPAEELFARHHGNVRDALRELYDVYAADPATPGR